MNEKPVHADRDYVLYWMVANRRVTWNYALQRAVWWAEELGRPVVVFEPLRSDYPNASERFHQFIVDGMRDTQSRLATRGIAYYPYLEATKRGGRGLLAALAGDACVVVTDDYPTFFLPRMIEAAGRRLDVRLEAVDASGLVPMGEADKAFARAHDFRRFVHGWLPDHFDAAPLADPLRALDGTPAARVAGAVTKRWPRAALDDHPLDGIEKLDRSIAPVEVRGGQEAARRVLTQFVRDGLGRYDGSGRHPDDHATSELSAHLHFGHLSTFEVLDRIADAVGWSPLDVHPSLAGRRRGWWGASDNVEGYLDQVVTWRELGFNGCRNINDHTEYDTLPDWARRTLDDHRTDPRQHQYERDQFERAATHDDLWNAAQRQLVTTGRIHNYLRMLWGKKILEWSPTPEDALETMFALNDKYAIDGRDPNSVSGITWVMGRYDRAWGPERPIVGKVRYMTSGNTKKKLRIGGYIERFGGLDGRGRSKTD